MGPFSELYNKLEGVVVEVLTLPEIEGTAELLFKLVVEDE